MNLMLNFDKIWRYVRTDGLLHIETCALIGSGTLGLMRHLVGYGWALLFAIIVTSFIAIGKEVWDAKSGKGTAEWHDIICDSIGMLIGIVIGSL